jgi:hypothetical protein
LAPSCLGGNNTVKITVNVTYVTLTFSNFTQFCQILSIDVCAFNNIVTILRAKAQDTTSVNKILKLHTNLLTRSSQQDMYGDF